MNLVDSCGWLECFAGGSNAHHYADAIEAPETLVAPAGCVYEVAHKLLQFGDTPSALEAIGVMMQGAVVALDAPLALESASLAQEHKLSMADAVMLATARKCGARLLTQDTHFEGIDGVNLFS